MEKNLLLVTAFLAVVGTTMAADNVAKPVAKPKEEKKESFLERVLRYEEEFKNSGAGSMLELEGEAPEPITAKDLVKDAEKVADVFNDLRIEFGARSTDAELEIDLNRQEIAENAIKIQNNKKVIVKNAQDIRDLRKDHNKGMAQMAAMASVDFGNVKARTVKVGAGIGQHASETAVAVGVAVTPTDALMINAKWSTSTNSIKKSTLGLGATYEFNF